MADQRELDRYRKLLEDWKPSGSGPKPKTSPASSPAKQGFMPEPMLTRNTAATPRPSAPAQVAAFQAPAVGAPPGEPLAQPTAAGSAELATAGAILLLSGHTPVIYQRPVPEKEYHLILLLTPNGTVKLQGIALQAHQVEEIGKLPPHYLQQLESTMTWDRDLIVFHCYRYEDARRVPVPAGGAAPPTATPAAPPPASAQPVESIPADDEPLTQPNRRGQRLHIKFGQNSWFAIYWGTDAQGQVVAHNTHGKWSLMHLDLTRFGTGLEIDPHVDEALIAQVESALLEG